MLTVTSESRFVRTPDGRTWSTSGTDRSSWTRYLSVFDRVRVTARVTDAATAPAGARLVDGDRIEVLPVPYYLGPGQFLTRRRAVRRALTAAAAGTGAVIVRMPSILGVLLATARQRQRQPVALEIIGDPYDVFAPGVVEHPLRPVLRRWFVAKTRAQCRSATAVAYETEHYLQRRYPAGPGLFTTAVSCVELPDAAFATQPRESWPGGRGTTRLISVGSLAQLYKGIDTLIEAVARLRAAGTSVSLVHVGDGRYRPTLTRLAERLGVADAVTFTGWLPAGQAVRDQLDAADLFVMPSRTEGLPRALIEAMARSLPAVGSAVGGIPELLPEWDLVRPGDPSALAELIGRFVADPARMRDASVRNLARSHDFSATVLAPRRDAFYQVIRDATQREATRQPPSVSTPVVM